MVSSSLLFFFFQAEDGIRDVERSRGLGDVYKRQLPTTGVSSTLEVFFLDGIWERLSFEQPP